MAEKVFGSDDRRTPAIAMEDGADYVTMGTARIWDLSKGASVSELTGMYLRNLLHRSC